MRQHLIDAAQQLRVLIVNGDLTGHQFQNINEARLGIEREMNETEYQDYERGISDAIKRSTERE